MGSGSYVDLVVIKPKDDVQYLRTFDEANVKVSCISSYFPRKTSLLTNVLYDQGERREKYTYPKGATAVLSEKVRDIKVRQVGGSQVSFHGFLLDFPWISSEFSSNFSHLLKGWGQEPRLHRGLRGGETDCNGGGLGDLGGCPRLSGCHPGQSDGTFKCEETNHV